ncbi:hypothetical protein ACOSQ2_014141 [Xanthoceras sorbifolium]
MIELPEGYIATMISLTSPCDAYLLSCVNSLFKLATESDAIWDRFLPADYGSLICNLNFCSSSSAMYKKELHLSLYHNPSYFQLDKLSGMKCYMISARKLTIVAKLIHMWWLEIRNETNTSILSPRTTYGAYLVFKMVVVAYGFVNQAAEVSFGLIGSDSHKRAVYLDLERGQRPRQVKFPRRISIPIRSLEWQVYVPKEIDGYYRKERGDGWLEIELGKGVGKKNVLKMSVMKVTISNWKGGLSVQGIEIRPKQSK